MHDWNSNIVYIVHLRGFCSYCELCTLTPERTPVVDTLKSRYAISSDVGALYGLSSFFRGMSSVSMMGGMVLGSRRAAASW